MKYIETLFVNKEKLNSYKKLLETEPKNESECLGEDETIENTVRFSNGKQADIKICGVQFEEGESNKPYAEVVLFNEHGCEITHTDCDEEYDGDWELEDNDDKYVVSVVPYTDGASLLEIKRKLVEEASIEELEDFLGYPVTGNKVDLSQLWNQVSDVAAQMPDEHLKKFEEKYLFVA